MRGRVIGIYFYAFNGTGPAAGLLAGWLCAKGGSQLAFIVAGAVGLVGTAAAAARLRRREPLAPREVVRTAAAGLTARQ
jgi:MFS family permease